MAENLVACRSSLHEYHEYHQMIHAGILTEDDRVELLEGEIIGEDPY